LILAFIYKWDMALVLIAISPMAGFGAWYMGEATKQGAAAIGDAYAAAGGTASETLSELRTVAALSLESNQQAKYSKSLEAARRAGVTKSTKVAHL